MSLPQAKALATKLDQAHAEVNKFLAPFLKSYIQLLAEVGSVSDFDATADNFTEIDHEYFVFNGEEAYHYGEYDTPSLSMPFAFVEDPKAYSDKLRKQKSDNEAKVAARTRKRAQERIDRLQAELDKEREILSAADEKKAK